MHPQYHPNVFSVELALQCVAHGIYHKQCTEIGNESCLDLNSLKACKIVHI